MKSHSRLVRGSIATVAVLVLIAAHVALFGLATGARLSLMALAWVVGVVVLKYAWWKFRRHVDSESRLS